MPTPYREYHSGVKFNSAREKVAYDLERMFRTMRQKQREDRNDVIIQNRAARGIPTLPPDRPSDWDMHDDL